MDSGQRPSNVDEDSLSELSRDVSQTATTLFSAGSVTDTLACVLELAVTTIEGCDFAALFIKNRERSLPRCPQTQRFSRSTPCSRAPVKGPVSTPSPIGSLSMQMTSRQTSAGRISHPGSRRGHTQHALPSLGGRLRRSGIETHVCYPAAFGIGDQARATILASLASLALIDCSLP